jgi:hypothetical protein
MDGMRVVAVGVIRHGRATIPSAAVIARPPLENIRIDVRRRRRG